MDYVEGAVNNAQVNSQRARPLRTHSATHTQDVIWDATRIYGCVVRVTVSVRVRVIYGCVT